MVRVAAHALVVILTLASAARAAIVDPVFVRGNKNLSTGWFDQLSAFESVSDMVSYQNPFWTHPMSNPNYSEYQKSTFFDGTNYYWIDSKNRSEDSFYLHNYGPNLENLINDSGADTQVFVRSANDTSHFPGLWFADPEGGVYNYYERMIPTNYPGTDNVYLSYFRRHASIADVLADSGTRSAGNMYGYNFSDRFFVVNGKFYRTNTVNGSLLGFAVYNSFDDLVANRTYENYGGGVGSCFDLFMVVPRSALLSVPEPSTCAMAFVGMAVGGYSRWRRRHANQPT